MGHPDFRIEKNSALIRIFSHQFGTATGIRHASADKLNPFTF
jgi:hypothetical protein